MPEIRQLAPHVADLIAAGEVVERPASVVKELLENAIDAGASAVTVEIQNGGMRYIRVTDDGCGIAPEQLSTAFLRHATSKLRTAADLEAIGTLGFRGEALAAIAAVSEVSVLTRQRGAETGASLTLTGGVPGEQGEAGCPEGTTLVVRDLFYNTPARLKFMKKDSAEAAAVSAVVEHLALSHPHLSLQLIRDGQTVLHTPGDSKLSSAVYSALGREFAMHLVEVSGCGEGVEVSGYVTSPLYGRGTRGMQTFFVNGRYIKSQLLSAAVEEAYRNQQLKGRFPGCVLHLTVEPGLVDVNVHPAKTVVKFVHERQVFSAVHHLVQDALDRPSGGAGKGGASPLEGRAKAAPRQDFYRTMDAAAFRRQLSEEQGEASPVFRRPPALLSERPGGVSVRDVARTPRAVVVLPPEEEMAPAISCSETKTVPSEQAQPSLPAVPPVPSLLRQLPVPSAPEIPSGGEQTPPAEAEQTTFLPVEERTWRMVGEVLRTYIVAEDGEDVWLIDKHAAHERINFDRLKAAREPVQEQQLLTPEAVKLPPEDFAALMDQLSLLSDFGFAVEEFGPQTLLIRAIPTQLDVSQAEETLEELGQRLRTCAEADPSFARDTVLHTMACKAAIKGGWVSDPKELQALVDRVAAGEVRYCPHGRPVAVKLTRYELEKMFKRA